jgi:hypothetical protein
MLEARDTWESVLVVLARRTRLTSMGQRKDKEAPVLSLAAFLVRTPPLQRVELLPDGGMGKHAGVAYVDLPLPSIRAHCASAICGGDREFDVLHDNIEVRCGGVPECHLLEYGCRNCKSERRTYAIEFVVKSMIAPVYARKLGQLPPFGDPLPARVFELIDADRELMLRARRCTSASLGIGAFAYYRRIVERNWRHLVGELHTTAQKLEVDAEILRRIDKARTRREFSAAVKDLRNAIPASLLIAGKNPITLLHRTLSVGVHVDDDADCLVRASAIESVLVHLATRMKEALAERSSLEAAMKALDSSTTASKVKKRTPRSVR